MDTNRSKHIQDQLRRYLQENSTLEDLEHWFTFDAWNAHQTGDDRAALLVVAIQDVIVAHNNGVLVNDQPARASSTYDLGRKLNGRNQADG